MLTSIELVSSPRQSLAFREKLAKFVTRLNDQSQGINGTLLAAYELGNFLRKHFPDADIEATLTLLKPYIRNNLPLNNIKNILIASEANSKFYDECLTNDINPKIHASVKDASILCSSNIIRGVCFFAALVGIENNASRFDIAGSRFNLDDAEILAGLAYINQTVVPLVMQRSRLEESFRDVIAYGQKKLCNSATEFKGTIAVNLGEKLLEASSEYFLNFHNSSATKPFEHKCQNAIASSTETLGMHTTPSWMRMISKLTQIIVGVVTGLLPLTWAAKKYYSFKTTGHGTFFHDVTVGQGKLDKIEKDVREFSLGFSK